jgi:hypothetical protein
MMLAAIAGLSLWLFQPWSGLGGDSGASGGDGASGAAPPSAEVDGTVHVETSGETVTRLVVPIVVLGEGGLSLDGSRLHAETALAETALAAVPATFVVEVVDGNGDAVLDAGEHALLTVELPASSSVHPENPLSLTFALADGGRLVIKDVLGSE